jgi:hypothetical protein
METGKMKKIVYLLLMFTFTATTLLAQVPIANKADEELTKDEAIVRINEFTMKVQDLTNTLNSLETDVEKAKVDLDKLIAELKDCNKDLAQLIGATDADITAFGQKLGQLEGKVRSMKGLANDVLAERVAEVKALEDEWRQLASNKISVLPQFYDRMVTLHKDIKGLYRTPSTKSYTVGTWAENRDCLWNIAGNIDIYGDPFMWPKIWQANTELVRNPDIIHPGQVLKVPPKSIKTDDEIKAERKYWRKKKAVAATKVTEATEVKAPTTEKSAQKGN